MSLSEVTGEDGIIPGAGEADDTESASDGWTAT